MSSPILPVIPDGLELIKLRDCYPLRRLYPALEHFTDRDTGVLDYASDEARKTFDDVDEELHKLGFRREEVKVWVGQTLIELTASRGYTDYMQEPGDLLIQIQEPGDLLVQV